MKERSSQGLWLRKKGLWWCHSNLEYVGDFNKQKDIKLKTERNQTNYQGIPRLSPYQLHEPTHHAHKQHRPVLPCVVQKIYLILYHDNIF